MAKLNQVIATEKGIKGRVYGEVTELHKKTQKPEPFSGHARVYRVLNEEGEILPSDNQKVQLKYNDVLSELSKLLTQLFDVTVQKDNANCIAVADVVVDGAVLLKGVPATSLIFLEKQLTDVRTFVDKLPILSESDDWNFDTTSGLYKTDVVSTHRTKKMQRPIVLYEATKEHPAQTQIITEDILVGYWDTVKHSGAIPGTTKKGILEKIEKLLNAVKFAREKANEVEASPVDVGSVVFGYLFQ